MYTEVQIHWVVPSTCVCSTVCNFHLSLKNTACWPLHPFDYVQPPLALLPWYFRPALMSMWLPSSCWASPTHMSYSHLYVVGTFWEELHCLFPTELSKDNSYFKSIFPYLLAEWSQVSNLSFRFFIFRVEGRGLMIPNFIRWYCADYELHLQNASC